MLARAISVSEYILSRSRGTSAKLNDAISQESVVVVDEESRATKIPAKTNDDVLMRRTREKNRCNITFIYILVVLLSKKSCT